MPWRAEKRGDRWAIVRADTGEVVGWSESEAKAKASVRARYANMPSGEMVDHAAKMARGKMG